jgi:hypothetical protein
MRSILIVMTSCQARLETALHQTEPSRAACELAGTLRDEGMSQLDMYWLFDEFRAIHERDADGVVYDAVLDTMDIIVGWCGPGARLYETQL